MNLTDLRRLVVTTLILAGLTVLWTFFLLLHDGGQFTWRFPEVALGWFGIKPWLVLLFALTFIMVYVVGLLTFAIQTAPKGYAAGKMRQVQCQACKAVFFVHDSGHRPLTHECPSCKALGVYDGKHDPVGRPPQLTRPVHTKVRMTCHVCKHKFSEDDDGRRPMKVTCPSCNSKGQITT